jgi:type IV secretory pathway VirB4 component
MATKNPSAKKAGVSAQRFLDIAEIRDGVVILKDGSLRSVLLVSSINFALKSVDEQNAIVQAYMQFLNSIDFPIQVIIQSRKMNIDAYLRQLSDSEKTLPNELLKRQIRDYSDFIKQLVQLGDIMQKRFFIVVPYSPLMATGQDQKGFMQRIGALLSPASLIHLSEERFQKQRFDLGLRINQIISGLGSMSLTAVQLDTQGLIELYYTVYNPELYDTQRLADVNKLQIEDL